VAIITGQEDIVIKILSVDPRNYPDAPTEAIRLVLERFYGKAIPRGTKLDLKDVGEDHAFPDQEQDDTDIHTDWESISASSRPASRASIPGHFPSVFGPNEDEPLNRDIVVKMFEDLTETINQYTGRSLSWAEVADG